jgi:glutamate dehydrogenase
MVHYVSGASQLMPTLSYQRLHTEQVLTDEDLHTCVDRSNLFFSSETDLILFIFSPSFRRCSKIKRTAANAHDLQVLESFLIFNRHVLKTNLYTPTKVAISFRLDPGFLPEVEYPRKPYGIFLVVGSEFRGFHVRFKDVARGGIRIIRSRNREAYSINQRNLWVPFFFDATVTDRAYTRFPENYALGKLIFFSFCTLVLRIQGSRALRLRRGKLQRAHKRSRIRTSPRAAARAQFSQSRCSLSLSLSRGQRHG